MTATTPLTSGVHHVGLTVPNLARTREFFVEVLGFEQVVERALRAFDLARQHRFLTDEAVEQQVCIGQERGDRIEAHIFIAFLAYCLQVTLKQRLRALALGLTPRAALEKFATLQMVDVHLPTTDGRTLILSRYTEPEKDLQLLLQQLRLRLPEQPPPRITSDLISKTA